MTGAARLLFVSPVVPARTGSGLAMRAHVVLQALARRYDTWLLVVPLHGQVDAPLAPDVLAMCRDTAVLQEDADAARLAFQRGLAVAWSHDDQAERLRTGAWPFRDQAFEVVHVYRLTALPYALPYALGAEPRRALDVDLDEAESVTRRRLAESLEARGEHAAARFARLEADRAGQLEASVLAHARRVYVCSTSEREALAPIDPGATIHVVPNAVEMPTVLATTASPAADVSAHLHLLFVGSLGFPANDDAVRWCCETVLPLVRHVAARPLTFTVVGTGASAALVSLAAEHPDITLAGWVDDLAPCYARAHVAVAPLRSGGGTRLKILEAMSHGCAVVSTTIGADGLAVEDGRHLAIADDAQAFARQCVRLADDPILRASMGEQAHAFVLAHHTPAAVAAALDR